MTEELRVEKSSLVSPKGEQLNTDGTAAKRLSREQLAFLWGASGALMAAEAEVFDRIEGNAFARLKACHEAKLILEKVLTFEESKQGRVHLAPHLFGVVKVVEIPPKPTKVYVSTWEVRRCFEALRQNGYEGVPVVGLSPLRILEQVQRDVKHDNLRGEAKDRVERAIVQKLREDRDAKEEATNEEGVH